MFHASKLEQLYQEQPGILNSQSFRTIWRLVNESYFPSRCEGCFDGRLPLLLIVVFIGLVLFLLCIGVILDAEGNFSALLLQTLIFHNILQFPSFLLIIIISHLNHLLFVSPQPFNHAYPFPQPPMLIFYSCPFLSPFYLPSSNPELFSNTACLLLLLLLLLITPSCSSFCSSSSPLRLLLLPSFLPLPSFSAVNSSNTDIIATMPDIPKVPNYFCWSSLNLENNHYKESHCIKVHTLLQFVQVAFSTQLMLLILL